MTATQQTRDVPFAPENMFALVSGIEQYPDFLPWCAGARIRKREAEGPNEVVTADLIVSYKMFREQFTSRVTLDKAERKIDVNYVQGPFKYLTNKWHFELLPNGVFAKAFSRMMQAFIDEAEVRFTKVVPSAPTAEFEPDQRNDGAEGNQA